MFIKLQAKFTGDLVTEYINVDKILSVRFMGNIVRISFDTESYREYYGITQEQWENMISIANIKK